MFLQMTESVETENGLDIKRLIEVLDWHDDQKIRLRRLGKYYRGEHDILDREKEEGKPNNKIVSGFPKYIVDMIQGYTFGKPVNYKYSDDNMAEDFHEVYKFNDEIDENSDISNLSGIYGTAFELVYNDEEGRPRFNEVSPMNGFLVYDDKITPEPLFGVRRYLLDLDTTLTEYVEVYTKDWIYYLKRLSGTGGISEREEPSQHFFGDVPMIEYPNNTERSGDFEHVMSYIDSYDKAISDKLNDLEYFTDAYLYLVGMSATESEEVDKLRENRVLLLEENGEAGFLTKDSNDAESEHIKNRMNQDVHKFAFVPDLSDENFANNASGVAMAYKLFGTEQLAANKERKFTTGLMRRIELLCNYFAIKNKNYNFRDVEVHFTRNVPVDEKAAAEIFAMLKGRVSDELALSILPMVSDINAELKRMEGEIAAYSDDMS